MILSSIYELVLCAHFYYCIWFLFSLAPILLTIFQCELLLETLGFLPSD